MSGRIRCAVSEEFMARLQFVRFDPPPRPLPFREGEWVTPSSAVSLNSFALQPFEILHLLLAQLRRHLGIYKAKHLVRIGLGPPPESFTCLQHFFFTFRGDLLAARLVDHALGDQIFLKPCDWALGQPLL